jgi:hypothetical protein
MVEHVLLGNLSSELHVRLNIEQFLEANAPWFAGSSLKHEATKLGMKDGQRIRSKAVREDRL